MAEHEEVIRVEVATASGPVLAEVLSLYKSHNSTLGFLPIGAFEEKARDGYILVARLGSSFVGYLMYNMTRSDASIVHLCVDDRFLGRGVADLLVERLRKEIPEDCSIRLTCRADYKHAERVWRRLGFEIINTRVGRGADRAELKVWRWEPRSDRALLLHMYKSSIQDRVKAVIDANIYFDLIDPEQATGHESRLLAQEWLDDIVAFVRTPELSHEIYRNPDPTRRKKAQAHLGGYPEVRGGSQQEFASTLNEVNEVLPPIQSDQDESDHRHLAYAIAAKAEYMITRDADLLDFSEDIRQRFGILIVNPVDFVLSLDFGRNAPNYEPFRLAATSIAVRRVVAADRDSIESTFQRYPQREGKVDWRNTLARAFADLSSAEVMTLTTADREYLALYATHQADQDTLDITLLRAKGQKLALVAIRHVLMSIVIRASERGCRWVTCRDGGAPPIDDALADAGFQRRADGAWVRALLPGLIRAEELSSMLENQPELRELALALPERPSAVDYERLFWPLKVTGDELPCFIIPIQPHWAQALFDHALTGELFPAPPELACGLENVYYSGSSNRALLAGPARILWYVSQGKNDARSMCVRACSLLREGQRGPARLLFNSNKRLGIYQWYHISKMVKGDASKPITALRFSHTELLRHPVPWDAVQEILQRRTGKQNPLVGPVRVSEDVFFDVYKEATRRVADA